MPISENVHKKYYDRSHHNLLKHTARAAGGKHSLNKGCGVMIGDIYQILNNQDTSVCTAMPQIKGPFP